LVILEYANPLIKIVKYFTLFEIRRRFTYPQTARFRAFYQAVAAVQARSLVEQGLKGGDLAEAIRRARLVAIGRIRE
jgi:hypothetical protein